MKYIKLIVTIKILSLCSYGWAGSDDEDCVKINSEGGYVCIDNIINIKQEQLGLKGGAYGAVGSKNIYKQTMPSNFKHELAEKNTVQSLKDGIAKTIIFQKEINESQHLDQGEQKRLQMSYLFGLIETLNCNHPDLGGVVSVRGGVDNAYLGLGKVDGGKIAAATNRAQWITAYCKYLAKKAKKIQGSNE